MPHRVPFSTVRDMLQNNGWKFLKIKKPFRVFSRPGESPMIFRVDGNSVDQDDYERIKRIIQEDQERV